MGSTVSTIYASSGDGYLAKTYVSNYNDARDAASASSVYTGITQMLVGWGTAPALFRSFLYFDTSSIPVTAVISSVTLDVYLVGTQTVLSSGHKVYLFSGQTTYPSDPLVDTDFNRNFYSTGGSDYITCLNGQSGYKTFTFNSIGFGWIQLASTTKLCLMSGFDVTTTIPQDNMELSFYTSERGGSYRPVITITYTTKPVAVTNAATDIYPTYVTANGDTGSSGSESFVEQGFIYNDDGTDPVDIDSADHKIVSVTAPGGAFTAQLTGLSSATEYYYRAYITNGAGTGYGAATAFTTDVGDPVLTVSTDDASNIDVTTVTLNGNILEDAGHTILTHGFIYKAGADPGTPADPTLETSWTCDEIAGGSVGAFTADITGLTTGTIYCYRAYATTSEDGIAYGGLVVFRTLYEVELTAYSLSGDGYAQKYVQSSSIATARDNSENASSADSVSTSGNEIPVTVLYQYYSSLHRYTRRRGYVYFDTSSIPEDATIISCVLSLYVNAIHETPGHAAGTLYISEGMPTYPTESGGVPALAVGDYDNSKFSDIVYIIRGDISSGSYNDVNIGSTYINTAGLTKFRLKQNNTCGSDYTTCGYDIDSYEGTNKPKLVITYQRELTQLPQGINVDDTAFKTIESMVFNPDNSWHAVEYILINVGDEWKVMA